MPAKIVDVALTTDTAIYASADVLVATVAVADLCLDKNRACILQQITLTDEADLGMAMDIYFLSANTSMGAVNSPAGPTDAAMRDILCVKAVATGDWKDLGGARIASFTNQNIMLKPATDTSTVYVAIVNGSGTPTYAADSLRLRLGVVSID